MGRGIKHITHIRTHIYLVIIVTILSIGLVACQKQEQEDPIGTGTVVKQASEEKDTKKNQQKSQEETIPDDLFPGSGTEEAMDASASSGGGTGQVSGEGASASPQVASGSGASGANGGSSSVSNGSNGNDAAQGGQTNPSKTTVGVSFVVESSQAEAYGYSVNYTTSMELPKGSTVYDALKQSGINFSGSGYIDSIGGLPEKAVSATSGWKYYVNGNEPSMASRDYVLQEGDYVQWSYVLKP